jgi:hypothetical protein
MMIDAREWKWYGLAGHFTCGRWCRFHICTQVGGYLISSVGMLVHPRDSGGGEVNEGRYLSANPDGADIGCGRHYETMVFKAGKPCDAAGCACGLPAIDGYELAAKSANNVKEATANHMEMCKKFARRKR